MKLAPFAMLLVLAVWPGFAAAQQPAMAGADLFIDISKYAGRQVILTDGEVYGATNDGALVRAGGATFWISPESIDPETFRVFLKSCSGIGSDDPCKRRLVVTPTGQKRMNWPILTGVKFAP
jgi:hypothetical protein